MNLCNKRYLKQLVLLNLLFKGKGRIKRKSLGKEEWGHKRIQAVSPLFFWKREKRDTKRIQAISPC